MLRMKWLPLSLSLCILAAAGTNARVLAAKAVIQVPVVDKETGYPIPDAYVKLVILMRQPSVSNATAANFTTLGMGTVLFAPGGNLPQALLDGGVYVGAELSGYTDEQGICELVSHGGIDYPTGTTFPYPDYYGPWKDPGLGTEQPELTYLLVCAKGYFPNRRYESWIPFSAYSPAVHSINLSAMNEPARYMDGQTTVTLNGEVGVYFPKGAFAEPRLLRLGSTKGDATPRPFDAINHRFQAPVPAVAIISEDGRIQKFDTPVEIQWAVPKEFVYKPEAKLTVLRINPFSPCDEEVGAALIGSEGRTLTAWVDRPGIYVLSEGTKIQVRFIKN